MSELITMTDEDWSFLQMINTLVNERITYKSDQELYGKPEFWQLIETADNDFKGFGDCEDYALTKRDLLLKAGWPLEALRLCTVLTESSVSHAVLTVETTQGTYVLDNRLPDVQPWDKVHYRWMFRQLPGKYEWEKIDIDHTLRLTD